MPRGGKRSARTLEQKQEIADLYIAGQSLKELTEAYGVTQSGIYRILHELGVKPTRQKNGVQVEDLPAEEEEDLQVALTNPVPAKVLAVTVDAQDMVIETKPILAHKGMEFTWEIEFSGIVTVSAESIDLALAEARKRFAVRRIYSAKMKG